MIMVDQQWLATVGYPDDCAEISEKVVVDTSMYVTLVQGHISLRYYKLTSYFCTAHS